MKILAFDIGGTEIKYGIIDDGLIVIKGAFPSNAKLGGKMILDSVTDKAIELSKNDVFEGLAISSAGVIDTTTGVVIESTDAIPDFVGLNIKDTLESSTGLLTYVENDVNCVAIAESSFYPYASSLFFVTIGTGIGGAIVINQKLYHGHSYSAGEIGKFLFGQKTFESIASTAAIVQLALSKGLNIKNGKDLFELAENNHPLATSIVGQFYDTFSMGMASVIYLLNPQVIVIGGGLSARESVIDNIKLKLFEKLPSYYIQNVQIYSAKYKNDAGIMGAYLNFITKKNANA